MNKKDAKQFLQKSQYHKNEGFKQFFILFYSFQKFMASLLFLGKIYCQIFQLIQISFQFCIFTPMSKFSEQIYVTFAFFANFETKLSPNQKLCLFI